MTAGHLIDLATKQRIPLHETTLVGRKKECHISLDDARVSRQHAMIRMQENGQFWFYDLGSSNGSYINEQRVTTTRKLAHRDVLRICDYRYGFESGIGGDFKDISSAATDATIADIRMLPVILLVSDIKGYTKISENFSPDDLAETIGSWYRECDRVISIYGGTVDKFIGDAVLAYWMNTGPEMRLHALRAANALQIACQQIYAERHDEFENLGLKLESGVGLHLGKVAHGQMGEGHFTLLGDAVNLCFRLEALTRDLEKNVLVSEDFLSEWEEGRHFCEPEGSKTVKGKSKPLEVYSVALFPQG